MTISITEGWVPEGMRSFRAAKMANVHHFIKTLTGGYNFEVNEESTNISQGKSSF